MGLHNHFSSLTQSHTIASHPASCTSIPGNFFYLPLVNLFRSALDFLALQFSKTETGTYGVSNVFPFQHRKTIMMEPYIR